MDAIVTRLLSKEKKTLLQQSRIGCRRIKQHVVASLHTLLLVTLFVAVFGFTVLDVVKTDAFYQLLLSHAQAVYDIENTAKNTLVLLVAFQTVVAMVQGLIIGLLEQYVEPIIWLFLSFFLSVLFWMYFGVPYEEVAVANRTAYVLALVVLNCTNFRYSAVLHILGSSYVHYSIFVQFSLSVMPQVAKLLSLYYGGINAIFAYQYEFVVFAVSLSVPFVICLLLHYCLGEERLDNDNEHHDNASKDVEYLYMLIDLGRDGAWLCNLTIAIFLAAVYYDFSMYYVYANRRLNYTLSYDMVYIYAPFYIVAFIMSLGSVLLNVCRRKWTKKLHTSERARIFNRGDFYIINLSFFAVILSRVLFLYLQLDAPKNASLLLLMFSICMGASGCLIKPLLAKTMFCQRLSVNDDKLFKWFYLYGQEILTTILLFTWLPLRNYIGAWWFTATTCILLSISYICYNVYYYLYGKHIYSNN